MPRFIDAFLSFAAILCLLPIMLPLFVLLKCTGEGDVFYFQKRKGKNGEEFFLVKLATMQRDSVKNGLGSITARNDSRVTFIGKILRKWKLNELPQVWNILVGDLAIVGPRPLIEGTTGYEAYSEDLRAKIFSIRPGLTGVGSIVLRDEERILSNTENPHDFYTNVLAPYKAELELWYIKNKSFVLDAVIILCTAITIIKPSSQAYRKIFKTLPPVPSQLANQLSLPRI